MKRLILSVGGVLLAISLILSCQDANASDARENHKTDMFKVEVVLEFETMVGVDGPFLGTTNPIREINGGGLPWVLEEAEGELKSNGKLKIRVRGLIIPESVPGFGFNPAPFFLAAVSCLTTDGDGVVVAENVFTASEDTEMIGDPRNGDANIRAMLMLPEPCIAPIVFVTSPGEAWFAATGL